jgi:hypothetical protein
MRITGRFDIQSSLSVFSFLFSGVVVVVVLRICLVVTSLLLPPRWRKYVVRRQDLLPWVV